MVRDNQLLFQARLPWLRRACCHAIMATKLVRRGTMNSVTHKRVGEQSAHWLPLHPINTVNGKWISRKRVADPRRDNAPFMGRLCSIHSPMISRIGYTTHDGTRPSVKVKTNPPSRLIATAATSICIQLRVLLAFWLWIVIYSLLQRKLVWYSRHKIFSSATSDKR